MQRPQPTLLFYREVRSWQAFPYVVDLLQTSRRSQAPSSVSRLSRFIPPHRKTKN